MEAGWSGPTKHVKPTAETTISLSQIQVKHVGGDHEYMVMMVVMMMVVAVVVKMMKMVSNMKLKSISKDFQASGAFFLK